MGKDRILRATSENGDLRLLAVSASAAIEAIGAGHGAGGEALRLLGETGVCALLLAADLKTQGVVQVRRAFTGDLSLCQGDATSAGRVRGMIPHEEIHNWQGRGAEGALALVPGLLQVRKLDSGGRSLFESVVGTASLEAGPTLENYLRESEQVAALAGVDSRVGEADDKLLWCGGWLVAAFPGLDTPSRSRLELLEAQRPRLEDFAVEGGGLDLERLLQALTGSLGVKIRVETPVEAYCPCSREAVKRALISLGRDELRDMALSEADAEVFCEFCRRRYAITPGELLGMLGLPPVAHSHGGGKPGLHPP